MEGAVLRALALTGQLRGPVRGDIVRFRPKGAADRRIKVEYLPDPDNAASVLMRLTPASAAEMPASATSPQELLSTQQAADLVTVSRPYVAKLVDQGVFDDVVRTAAGHRRIPKAAVERVQAEMRLTRRRALDEVETLSKDLLGRELEDARQNAKTRWVPGDR